MIIYKIINLKNGKMYIGQTIQKLTDRWSDHSRPCLGTHKTRSAIGEAIKKYGKESFTIEELDTATSLEELNIKEITYIKALNTLCPNGYNMELGGGSKLCHEDTKIKISQKLKGRSIEHRWTGGNTMPRTDEQKAHLSSLNKGKPNVSLYKEVLCVDTGVVYESVNAAAKAYDVNRVTISSLIKTGTSGRLGVKFKFVSSS